MRGRLGEAKEKGLGPQRLPERTFEVLQHWQMGAVAKGEPVCSAKQVAEVWGMVGSRFHTPLVL